ncbi:phosphoenolpyruvate carboxylase [Candidatus Daviesbacteria bacterium]|nr:phosphoenolpyruvate carboxylase [Candidatus Daviesbacteria bacterium]
MNPSNPSRKIPSVMFSQHPDHAQKPYWHKRELIKTHDELKECFLMFKELGAHEVMWDWEGKLVDEAVIERLLGKYTDFFKTNQIGKEIFLTFRVPNPRVESGYRLGRAFMVILSGQDISHLAGFSSSPLFEVILPMTESAEELINIQKSFSKIAGTVNDTFGPSKASPLRRGASQNMIEIIPIFESVQTILTSGEIVKKYAKLYEQQFKQKLPYLRPFCARSDPSLNSGIVPTTLAIKWALSEYSKITSETGIPMYPIIAPGTLPFRGGLTPETFEAFLKEFAGVRTLVIQSAFRYDFPIRLVKNAIKKISRTIGKLETQPLSKNILEEIKLLIPWFEAPYQQAIEKIAPLIAKISSFIPQRRERVQHIGLFGYSREVGKVKLPRAIGFTASCYCLGIPPELIGTGQGLKKAKLEGKLALLEFLYLELRSSLLQAGRFFRKESLKELKLEWLEEDIKGVEEYLGEKLGPKTKEEKKHARIVSKIIEKLNKGQNPQKEIEQAAILRHGLG